jgi:hypothetical protein
VLTPDGSDLVWASYVGVDFMCRDIDIDADGDIYLPFGHNAGGPLPPVEWFAHAYQGTPQGGRDAGVVKVLHDGSAVVWATWLGGSANDGTAASIRVDAEENVYYATNTHSSDIPTTPGAFDRTYNGASDFYVVKLTPDGSALIFATYLGGSGEDWLNTHNLAIDAEGNAYVSVCTLSADYPTTPGALDQTFHGGIGQYPSDIAITKLSPSGAMIASTYLGGNNSDNPDGMVVDDAGNVFFAGATSSTDFPITDGAYQAVIGGGTDVVLVQLAADFGRLLYSSFLGGPSNDGGGSNDYGALSGFLDRDGSIYVTGSSLGPGWPAVGAVQPNYAGGASDVILAKLVTVDVPNPTITPIVPTSTTTPSPTSTLAPPPTVPVAAFLPFASSGASADPGGRADRGVCGVEQRRQGFR